MYVAKSGKPAPAIDRKKVLAAIADAALKAVLVLRMGSEREIENAYNIK